MNITQIENNIKSVFQNINKETFIYDFLLSYNIPKASAKKLKDGGTNLSNLDGEILWKKKLFYKVELIQDLHEFIDSSRGEERIMKHSPRFIIVTNFETFLSFDTKTHESLDIPFSDLPKHFDFFLPMAGMEKAQHQLENPADVKAAERMGKLYDEIKKDNSTETQEEVHSLNVFLTRLLFCFFAEDTNIFEDGQFTGSISSHTQQDGSDLNTYFERLFEVMNLSKEDRADIPAYLNAFPYVNGGLFRDYHQVPSFSRRSRQIIIESGELDWSAINPDIFGSMIQAVITPEHRGGLGMHYTSVPNIMKVIEPLFLNELNDEFEKGKHEPKKLYTLLDRLGRIKIFDPACGSGNFLIIAYKELRQLEIKILYQLKELQSIASGFEPKQLELIPKQQLTLAASFQIQMFSRIELSQFYGIELDDFAHEVAILSLWLAQHQMNVKFKELFGAGNPTLPLQNGGNIIHGNATVLNWEEVCPKEKHFEVYILGNPPYLGQKMQNAKQKEELFMCLNHFSNYKTLDYISIWFYKAANYIDENSSFAFVSTNSVCQGSHVSHLWPHILKNNKNQIIFAIKNFKWSNSAKNKAGVICSIIGVGNKNNKTIKTITENNTKVNVDIITPYLTSESMTFVEQRSEALSDLPKMVSGNMALDDGHLLLEESEKEEILNNYPDAKRIIKETTGGRDFLHNIKRWCLWIEDEDLDFALTIPPIKERIDKCFLFRQNGGQVARTLANRAHQFRYRHLPNHNQIIVPQTTSENREYMPFGFLSNDIVVQQSAQVLYDPPLYIFSLLSSRIHLLWVRAVGSKHGFSIRYSPMLCYNTFPFRNSTNLDINLLNQSTIKILEIREKYSEKTLAELYDQESIPDDLLNAHKENDLIVESFYRKKGFENDQERIEHLFKLYNEMISNKMHQTLLFASNKKK